MKWTKFLSDFGDGGSLQRLLKPGDKLIRDPKTPVHPAERNIWVSAMHDPLIDNCFRIYSDYESLEKHMWNGDPKTRETFYHPWLYYENVPEEYKAEEYFSPVVTERVAKEIVSQDRVYPNKDAKSRGAQPKKPQGTYSSNAKYIPHPYEVFTGGWVHFYDNEVRHGETDHAIYFEWDAAKMNVTVHIYQAKPILNWNVYVKVNPPTSQDPPPTKAPPPYC